MTQRLPTALLFFLIALSFSWNTAKAQELDALPAKIQGNWALPDCGIYDEALVFSRYFYLRSTKDSQTLLPAGVERDSGDYTILSLKDQKAPVQLENDGILTMAVLNEPPARRVRNWPTKWEKLPIEQTVEYTACTEPPSLIPQSMLRLMRYIDRVRDQCTLSVTNDCARVMFKFADDDSNQKITRGEIKTALVSMTLFSELALNGTLSLEEGRKAIDHAKLESDNIADKLFAQYDINKSGSLDYNELMENFTAPDAPIIRNILEKSGNLLPALKMAAMALPESTENNALAAAEEPKEDMPVEKKQKPKTENYFKRDY
jgi:hypothetical protein